jgi:alpha-glucosidase
MPRFSYVKETAVSSRIAFFALLFMTMVTSMLHLGADTAQAAQASLSWTAPSTYTDGTPLTTLGGYKLYTGTASGSYAQNIDVGKATSYTLTNLNDATTYFFAVKAYGTAGDLSGYSNQASLTTAAAPSPLYTLSASAGSGGTITPTGSVIISKGTSQQYIITPGSGYTVGSVTIDGTSVGAVTSYTFSNVTASHTISVSFLASTVPPPPPSNSISHTGWTLKYADTQESGWAATNAFDGSSGTFWNTPWKTTKTACPHEIQINLGQSYSLNSFSYLPRQDGNTNGIIANYEFYVSSDGVNWGTPVAKGTFTRNNTLKTVSFPAKTGKFMRLLALSEINGGPWTTVAELNVTGTPAVQTSSNIAHTNWTLKSVDSQETGWAGTNAFDGSTGTFWNTQWSSAAPAGPHEIQIKMGQSYSLDSFSYQPRQDGYTNGTIADYEFYVSTDGVTWGTPVAKGTFAKDTSLKRISFPAKAGQYIRLRALTEINGGPWTTVAELNVTGY